MTQEQVERYGKAWEAGQREDRECGLCANFIRPGQWMHYHYNADGSRALEHVVCDHPEMHQEADELWVPPDATEHRLSEAGERAPNGPRDLTAPGSPEWCWQNIALLKTYYRYVGNRWQEVLAVLAELAEHRAWEKVPSGKPYGSEDQLLKAELGISKGQVEDLDRLLAGHDQAQRQRIRTRGRSAREGLARPRPSRRSSSL